MGKIKDFLYQAFPDLRKEHDDLLFHSIELREKLIESQDSLAKAQMQIDRLTLENSVLKQKPAGVILRPKTSAEVRKLAEEAAERDFERQMEETNGI